MKQKLPIEGIARQRLDVLVNAITLFIKNLMEEGVDRDKVKAASDRVWQILGQQAGETLTPLYSSLDRGQAVQQAGDVAMEIHDMTFERDLTENGHTTNVSKCPWQDAAERFGVPEQWRLCQSAHLAFGKAMNSVLNPGVSVEMEKTMPKGDAVCSEIVRYAK